MLYQKPIFLVVQVTLFFIFTFYIDIFLVFIFILKIKKIPSSNFFWGLSFLKLHPKIFLGFLFSLGKFSFFLLKYFSFQFCKKKCVIFKSLFIFFTKMPCSTNFKIWVQKRFFVFKTFFWKGKNIFFFFLLLKIFFMFSCFLDLEIILSFLHYFSLIYLTSNFKFIFFIYLEKKKRDFFSKLF